MYAWIWRRLPGRLPLRIIEAVLLAAAVVALLWFGLFPLLGPLLPFDDVTVG
ncbi:hypothetical protein Acsp03_46800 [Actinomadura sp. NBRC 104412]|uniref:hypothetical protein n=1 Tax=Actinomadura sp. NBRC 104412 TaxID=3032203 RepID=UPI0024A10F74|nr:hypothetical protein [Actinomadura sp. NBRC 104412]GLZ07214.1 hypothetical protein Acsp03_46800 [Actinomadura sp. NBRC 104412]